MGYQHNVRACVFYSFIIECTQTHRANKLNVFSLNCVGQTYVWYVKQHICTGSYQKSNRVYKIHIIKQIFT